MNSRAATDIRNSIALGVALMAASLIAWGLPFAGIPLAAFALAWVSYRFGWFSGVVVSLVFAGVAAFVEPALGIGPSAEALFTAVALLVAGPGAAWALTRRPALEVVAAVTAMLMLATLGLFGVFALEHGRSIVAEVAAAARASVDATQMLLTASGLDPKLVQSYVVQLRQTAVQLMPANYLYEMGLAAVLAVRAVSSVGRRSGVEVSSLPVLHELDLSFHFVWPAIGGLALVALSAFVKQPNGVIAAVGANLLLIVRPVLFFQGAATFAALYRRLKVGRFGRATGFVFLALSELVIPSVSIVGLADLFFNLRKLPRGITGQESIDA